MLRDFPFPAERALRACLVIAVAGAAVIALPGCGIKRPLTLPPAPAAAAPATDATADSAKAAQ